MGLTFSCHTKEKRRCTFVCRHANAQPGHSERERHPSPTVDDLVDALNGATTFTKLDLRLGYHQLSIAP